MALNDKNLIITPNIGSANNPKIDFVGADATTGPSTITAVAYPINNGTLSFEGTAGQLFSITNNLSSGSIFSVNDISGIPSIDVNANGTISMATYGGNLGIGTTNPTSRLDVRGNVNVVGVSTFTGSIIQNVVTLPAGSTYTLDVTAANEFVTAAAINGATTINLSNLGNLPTGYRWRGVFSFAYTSGVPNWFPAFLLTSGNQVKWDTGTAMVPTPNETETVVITYTGGSNVIEVTAQQGRA